MIMHVYQMRSSIPAVVAASQERIHICMNAMKEVSKVWLVAKMVHTLFESILGNKHLEERLQKAAGKKHQKSKLSYPSSTGPVQAPAAPTDGMKRKYDDMMMGFATGTPTHQVSYERSRPQSPVATPSQAQQPPNNLQPTSPNLGRSSDQFIPGVNSRGNTRPTTPFNVGFSVPATPPDLFLVTRNSPPISQQLWENFQPDQLFPDGSGISVTPFSPPNGRNPQPVDPALQMTPQMSAAPQHPTPNLGTSMPGLSPHDTRPMSTPSLNQMQQWPNMHQHHQSIDGSVMPQPGQQLQDDAWSNSSTGGVPVVPTALNVEDW